MPKWVQQLYAAVGYNSCLNLLSPEETAITSAEGNSRTHLEFWLFQNIFKGAELHAVFENL